MTRYAIIITIFIILAGYILYKAHIGDISAKFRTITLVLLSLLLLLSGIGFYANVKYYSVDSPEQEFADKKQEILARMKDYYQNEEYSKARELGEKYSEVRDEDLRRWYEKNLEKELQQKGAGLASNAPEQAIPIYERLWKLTSKPRYQEKLQQLRERIKKEQEKLLLNRLSFLLRARIGARFWLFKQLLTLYPENAAYRQQFEELKMKMRQKIQKSPWSDICSSADINYCEHIGMLAVSGLEEVDSTQDKVLGEILGVSRRPKGTLINRSGDVAPENAYYYIIDNQEKLFLQKCSVIEERELDLSQKVKPD